MIYERIHSDKKNKFINEMSDTVRAIKPLIQNREIEMKHFIKLNSPANKNPLT